MVRPLEAAVLIGVAGAAGGSSDKDCPPIAFAFLDVIVSDATTKCAGVQCCVAWNGKPNAEHTVTVTASGYEPFVATVLVKSGPCGPSESQSVEARLEKG